MSQSTKGMTAPTYAYHADMPAGRIFDLDNPEHAAELTSGGWVDSPEKIGADKPTAATKRKAKSTPKTAE